MKAVKRAVTPLLPTGRLLSALLGMAAAAAYIRKAFDQKYKLPAPR